MKIQLIFHEAFPRQTQAMPQEKKEENIYENTLYGYNETKSNTKTMFYEWKVEKKGEATATVDSSRICVKLNHHKFVNEL